MRTVVNRNGKLHVFTRRQLLQMGVGGSALGLAAYMATGSAQSVFAASKPSGQLNVALASFGTEAWMPQYGNTQDREVWTAFGDQCFGLNRKNAISFDPHEGLMNSYSIKESGSKVTWTVKLKKGIPFHSGEGTMTASDLKFTYLRYLQPKALASSAATKSALINGDPDNIQVVDDQTLVFNMDRSWVTPYFEYQLCIGFTGDFTGVIPEAYWNRVGDAGFRLHPVSTGPFHWVKYNPGLNITMEAVVPHWRKTPSFERLFIQKVPDVATRTAMLQSGEIDITGLSPLEIQQVENSRRIWLMEFSSAATTHIQLTGIVLPGVTKYHGDIYNPKLPWVGENPVAKGPVAVRAAMDYAIDRSAIAKSILAKQAQPGVMPFAWDIPGAKWRNPAWKAWPYDPDKGRQLMREAGFPHGFEMSVYVYSDQAPWQGDVVTAAAGYWSKELGIKVKLLQTEYDATVFPHIFDRNFDGIAWEFTDAGYQFPSATANIALVSWGTINYFEVAGFDAIIKQMEGVLDESKLNALTKTAGDFIYNNHLMHTIVDTHSIWGLNGSKIKAWDRTLHQPWMSGYEWVVKGAKT